MAAKNIHVIWKNPGNEPVPYEMEADDVDALQQLVGGYFEAIRVGPHTIMWANEDGKRLGLDPCLSHETYGPILGPVVFANHNAGGDQTDMKPLEMAQWMDWIRERQY